MRWGGKGKVQWLVLISQLLLVFDFHGTGVPIRACSTSLKSRLVYSYSPDKSRHRSSYLCQHLSPKEAFVGTLTNFVTRLAVCLSFVLIVALFPTRGAVVGGLVWGMSLLVVLTCILARYRKVSAFSEVAKHLSVAMAIIFVSARIGRWIAAHVA